MSEEATNDGSIEAAVAQLQEARAEAATPEPKKQPEAPEPAATVATGEPAEEIPESQEPADGEQVDPVEDDAGQEPPIEPPARWTAEDKEWFKTLPPERQERILRGEQGQRAAEVKRQQELNAEKQRFEQETQAAAQERQQLQSALQHYKHPMVTAFQQEFADLQEGKMDLFRLAQDPARWGRYQAFQTSFQQLAQAERQIAQQAEQEDNARLQQHIETRNSQLLDAKPELKDPAKFEQYDAEVSTYLRGLKIPDERIARVSFEELTIIEKAMKWDKAQKAKAAVPKPVPEGKVAIQGHVRSVPVLKPGMGSNAGGVDDKIAAIDQRARQSGSIDDAAARIRMRLGRRA